VTKINKKYDLAGQVRNRIVERRMMKASEIEDHPAQWRDHNAPQADAMAGVLEEVGIASTLKVWKSERAGGRYVAWDGHLRKSLDPDLEWPVDILDVTDAEADYLLAVFDPLAAMATADAGALDALLSSVNSGEAAVQAMLSQLAARSGLYEFDPSEEWQGMPEFEQEDLTGVQAIHVHFKTRADVEAFAELIGQKLTDKTRAIWYPEAEIERYADKRYSDES
jgi:hypothetical protein